MSNASDSHPIIQIKDFSHCGRYIGEDYSTSQHSDRMPPVLQHKELSFQGWRTCLKRSQTNGFVERFHRTVLDEFFRITFRTKFYESVDTLQSDLDAWLVEYNTRRPHQGYRNRGRRPMDVIQDYLKQRQNQLPASPVSASELPGAQPESRAESEASLDTGEHRATIHEAAGEVNDRREG